MNANWIRLPLAALLIMVAGWAQAAATYSCSLGAPSNYSQTYSNLSNSSTALSVTVTCVKSGAGGALTVNYSVTPNNGLNASGTQNRASLSGNFINYDLYSDAACTVPFNSAALGSMNFPVGGGTTINQTLNYFGCVPASQPSPPPAGVSGDTVSMTLAVTTPGVSITGPNPRTSSVAVTVNPACTVSVPGGSVIAFGTYVAFGGQKSANTPFSATCTLTTPYTLSLDVASGVLSGLNYSMLLNTTSSGGSHPLGPINGSGIAQNYFINGDMPANQAGTCTGASCGGTNIHTLTLTY